MRSIDSMERGGRATALLIALLAAAGLTTGCRSKLDVKTKSGGAIPAEEPPPPANDDAGDDDGDDEVVKSDPIEKEEALQLQGEKLYFQTRDIITVSVDKSILEGGLTYKLLNTTKSGTNDSKAQVLAEGDVDKLGLHNGFALVETGDKLQFQFFPGEEEWTGKFFYGKNTLKLFVDDETQPRFSVTELYLVDFDVFGVAVTAFSDNVQVASATGANGYQFQGWVNVLSPPTVKATGSVLTHGIFNMVNPQ